MKYGMQFAVTTLACMVFAGCASTGSEENYKVLDENPDTIRQGPRDPGEPDHRMRSHGEVTTIHLVSVGEEPSTADSPPTAEPAVAATTVQERSTGEPTDVEKDPGQTSPAAATAPAGSHILDRSNWERITVAPISGAVEHRPIYWEDYRLTESYSDPLVSNTVEGRLQAALEGGQANTVSRDNAVDFVFQPLHFAFDTVMLPVRLIQNHPFSTVTTTGDDVR